MVKIKKAVFSIMYGIISYSFRYYGEMITYIGKTLPMAAVSLVSWLKNPYKGSKSQVKVGRMTGKSVAVCFAVFFVNDIYGFISWRKMQKNQELNK